ncbi:hypothetical protein [Dankookia rubra]|nr:hypothetical protein [Dankookia rubra]
MVDLREEPSSLIGPPYGLSEIVFDEFDLNTVRLVPEEEVANWLASETL